MEQFFLSSRTLRACCATFARFSIVHGALASEAILPRIGDWEKQSDDSIKDAMEAQGLIEHSDKQMQDLDRAIVAKNDAKTDAETLQAIGEVNAVQTKQLNDLKTIIATDARAPHSVIMEQRAKEKELKNHEAQLMEGFNEHKKSRPLSHFPSLGSTAPQVSR